MPAGWFPYANLLNASKILDIGLSLYILISSSITFFSFSISSGSNNGLTIMSETMSKTKEKCFEADFIKYPVTSREVKALCSEPIASSSAWICPADGRDFVPLKNKCSIKWEMPFISFVSYFEPVAAKTRRLTLLASAIGAKITRTLFGKTFLINFINLILIIANNAPDFNFYRFYDIIAA